MMPSQLLCYELTIINEENKSPRQCCEEWDVPGLDDEVVKDLRGSDGPTSCLSSPLLDLVLKHAAGSWAGNERNWNLKRIMHFKDKIKVK